MVQEITGYVFSWNADNNEGTFQLRLSDGSGGTVLVDSAAEGSLLVDVLRNEKPVYFDSDHSLVVTGLEAVGEGEGNGKSKPKPKAKAKARPKAKVASKSKK